MKIKDEAKNTKFKTKLVRLNCFYLLFSQAWSPNVFVIMHD